MITKNNTPDRYKTAYLLLLPILTLLLFSFTFYNNGSVQMTENVISDTVKNTPSISPVNKKDITSMSGYGERKDPFTGKKTFHYAIDFAVPDGEPVVSTASGKVGESKTDSLKGNYVLIIHDNIYATLYSHLEKATVKPGENVKKGQVIGYVGNTGLSTGPHLHYEVYENGKRVNPSDFIPFK